jgi:tetratricopeptide (TPR) repeat protein
LKIGTAFLDKAVAEKVREHQRDLLMQAEEKFLAATTLDPTMVEALAKWASALRTRAWIEVDDEKIGQLLSQALDKFAAILVVKPDSYLSLASMGEVLSAAAGYKTPKIAAKYYAQAQQKFEAAIAIKPNDYETCRAWGSCLSAQARFASREVADKLLPEARQKFEAALRAKPNDVLTLVELGEVASTLAEIKTGREAARLYAEARRHFDAALKVKPDSVYALRRLSDMLRDQANQTLDKRKRQSLFEEAISKAKAAVAIVPNDARVLFTWGHALLDKSQNERGTEEIRLLREAQEKFEQSMSSDTNYHLPRLFCGNSLLRQAATVLDVPTDELVVQAERYFAEAVRLCPVDHYALHNWGEALHQLANAQSTTEPNKSKLLAQAIEKYSQVAAWKPDKHEALYDWGRALSDLAGLAEGAEADRLTRLANEKFAAAKTVRMGNST